ncbi:NTP transferase domain-containing protein [Parabacteroides goldsteinii]|jgi:cholinephosphate cytidylyltransferase|uniref:NTP transferase domain-containing protein n=1 Tax=Parabacteroides goldsteinii TaxID=328812 RepID=UPI00248F8821|nr:NTP transferase domain-containing protein [Parabacteroides goldsteinii]
MSLIKRNAIIMAAGTASRFVPLSAERPKGLLEVKGEILIERQIRQLKEAGVEDITIVVGYKAEMFRYLKDKFDINIVLNEDFYRYNNTSSVIQVLDILRNTYICSSDNYFPKNVFIENPKQSYYSALYADGPTNEYCLTTDSDNNIIHVSVGGRDSWYMIGHVFFSDDFSNTFRRILTQEYVKEETRLGYWEDLYIRFINKLPKIQIHRYKEHDIEEFDSIDELRTFDNSYYNDTRSSIVKGIAQWMNCSESDLCHFKPIKHSGNYLLFSFDKDGISYQYDQSENKITIL